MLTLAIMQPYFFPSLIYFQLISSVDKFVIFDDCMMKKKSYITRNSFKQAEREVRFSINVENLSQNRRINEHVLAREQSFLTVIREGLRGLNNLSQLDSVVDGLDRYTFNEGDLSLVDFNIKFLDLISDLLGLDFTWVKSSDIDYNLSASAQEKIIEIAGLHHATQYINLPGGRSLYSFEQFGSNGVELRFLNSSLEEEFLTNSIIYLIAKYGLGTVKEHLCHYDV